MINNFKEKVQAMSAKEIIMAMVEGLRNPVTKINMGTYGEVDDGVCYGCAATNAICKIGKISLDEFLKIDPCNSMQGFTKNLDDRKFIDYFENAINYLRRNYIREYNAYADIIGIAKIVITDGHILPYLDDGYTEEDLQKYVKLANLQE